MDCAHFRELISVRLDGEETELEGRALVGHLQQCLACRRHEATATSLHRDLRIGEVTEVPDQTSAILETMAMPPGGSWSFRRELLRALVAGLGVAKIAAAVGVFFTVFGGGVAPTHTSTELAAVDVAIGAGLLLAAWRPAKVTGLVPVLVVLAVVTLAGGGADLATGRVPWTAELAHLTDGIGALLVWRLTIPYRSDRRRIPIAT